MESFAKDHKCGRRLGVNSKDASLLQSVIFYHSICHKVTMSLDIASGLLDQVGMVVEEAANLPPGQIF